MKPRVSFVGLYLLAFAALTGLVGNSSLASEAKQPNTHGREISRFAGWLSPTEHYGVMLRVDQSGNYNVHFSAPALKLNIDETGRVYGLQVWLLTRNGGALQQITHGSIAWSSHFGDVTEVPGATFMFKPSEPLSSLYAVVIRRGDSTEILTLPNSIDRLSDEAQYEWDVLMSFPSSELEALELHHHVRKVPAFDRAIIEDQKRKLLQLGVKVRWDRQNRQYHFED